MGAAIFAALSAIVAIGAAAGSPCAPPTDQAVAAAKGLHRAAETHFHEKRYARAIDAWQLAYDLDCTAHRLLINIGNAHARAGDRSEAIAAYERYLERADDDETSAAVSARLAELRAGRSPEPAMVAPPEAGDATAATETSIAPIVVAAIAGAVATTGLVLVGLGVAAERDAEARCDDLLSCSRRTLDARGRGVTMQQAGGGLAALGFATAAGALLVGFLGDEGAFQPSVGLGSAELTIRF